MDHDVSDFLMDKNPNTYNLANKNSKLHDTETSTAASNHNQQVEINLEPNQNYQHYAELREQQLRVRETGQKFM